MSNEVIENSQRKLTLLNIAVIVLSVYVLGALLIEVFFKLPPETVRLLNYIDNLICIFFFADFCVQIYQAENKWRYMRWGWIDLVSSIPAVNVLRAGRLLRLIRLIRIVRAFKTVNNFVNHLFRNRAEGALTSVSVLALLIIIFSAITILQVEQKNPSGNIKTAEDAVWWAYVTVTTVGYGDKYPVTTEGRIIAAILMTTGVGMFGTFTAYVASWFVGSKNH